MKPINKPIIIFSVYQADKSEAENLNKHYDERLLLENTGIEYIETLGVYNGVKERSLIVDAKYESLIRDITAIHNQECYLLLDQDRNASLVTPKGVSKSIGIFKAVPDSYNGDYTQNISGGTKYAVVKEII